MYRPGTLPVIRVKVYLPLFLHQVTEHMSMTVKCCPVCRSVPVLVSLVQAILQTILVYEPFHLGQSPVNYVSVYHVDSDIWPTLLS